MGDESRIPLSYAKPDLALRANWPAVVSVGCVLLFPLAFGAAPFLFSNYRDTVSIQWIACQLVWVLSGVGAAVFGLIGLMRSRRLKIGGWWLALIGLSLGVINFVSIPRFRDFMAEYSQYQYGIGHSWTRCAIHMKSIGQSLMLYANENRGTLPDRLEDLILTQEIDPWVFVCPLSNDLPAAGATTQAVADNLSAGGSLSYVYLGKGQSWPSIDANRVLLYEKLGNHSPDFDDVNFLFGDGRVTHVPTRKAKEMIEQLERGINPPKP